MTKALRCLALTICITSAACAHAASSFTLDNVVIDGGGTIYRVARLDVTDSALSRDEMLALLAATDGVSPVQRLAKVSAARIATPELVTEQKTGDVTQNVIYRDVVFENIVAGKIAQVRAAGATVAMPNPNTGDLTGRTGGLSFSGIDLPAWAHLLVEGRTDPNETARTIVAAGRIDDMDLALPHGATARLGALIVRNLGGRALAVPMASLVDLAPKPDASPPSPERRRALSTLFADLLASQTLGTLEMTDLAVQSAPANGTSVKAGKVSIGDMASGRIGQMTFDDLAVMSAPSGSTTIGHFALAGLDLGPLLAAAAVADAPTPRLPRFDRVELDRLAAQSTGVGQPVVLTVAHAALDARDWRDLSPQSVALGVDHLAFDLPGDDPRARPLRDLGYSKVDLTVGLQAAYDAAKMELSLSKLGLMAPDVGDAALSLRLTNVGPEALSADTTKARAALAASLFRHATAIVSDGGLLTRMIEAQAKAAKATPADIRARWASGIRATIMAFLADNADRGTVADAAERFIRTGGKLSLDADAPSGLGLIDAMLAGGVQGLLGKVKLTVGN